MTTEPTYACPALVGPPRKRLTVELSFARAPMAEAASRAIEERIVIIDRTSLLCEMMIAVVMIVVSMRWTDIVVQSDGNLHLRKQREDRQIYNHNNFHLKDSKDFPF